MNKNIQEQFVKAEVKIIELKVLFFNSGIASFFIARDVLLKIF
jgi:hypothetical protein